MGIEFIRNFSKIQNGTSKKLSVTSDNLSASNLEALLKALADNQIDTLELNFTSLDADGAEKIAKSLENNTSTVQINLGSNNIGDQGAEAFARLLETNKTVKRLALYLNSIGDDGARRLAQALKVNGTLRELVLYGNKNIGAKGLAAISEALHSNITLEKLDLGYFDEMREDGALAIANALKNNDSLHALNLYASHIGPKGIHLIADAIKQNHGLHELNLAFNDLDRTCVTTLAESLEHNDTLSSLILEGNNIGDEGAQRLAKAISTRSAPITLDLARNKISGPGLLALARTLETDGLRGLILDGNNARLGGDEVNALAETLKKALKVNPNMIELKLPDTIGSIGKRAVVEGIGQSSNILHLNIHEGGLSSLTRKNLTAAWEYTNKIIKSPESLSREDFEAIKVRLPSIINIMYFVKNTSLDNGYDLASKIQSDHDIFGALRKVEELASEAGTKITLPNYLRERGQKSALYATAPAYLEKINPGKLASLETIQSSSQEHIEKICTELDLWASRHNTSLDSIIRFFQDNDPIVAEALSRLTSAEYDFADLEFLQHYAVGTSISEAPEKLALLQFINHDMLPHINFFNFWAKKMAELKEARSDIETNLGHHAEKDRPKLRLLGERAIQHHRLANTENAFLASLTIKPEAFQNLQDKKNRVGQDILQLAQELENNANGDIVLRHRAVKIEALNKIEEFKKYFSGVEKALERIDRDLDIKGGHRARAWQTFLSAEAINNQIEVLRFNSPENMSAYKSRLLWAGAAARALGNDSSVGGELLSGGVENFLSNQRYRQEYEIKINSLLRRQSGDSQEFHAAVEQLDAEIQRLTEDKEFHAFLVKSGSVEKMQAMNMLLTRLVAGESNIAAMEYYVTSNGYSKIDDFVSQLKEKSPRLGQGIEKFLYGLADSNDLEVILAEANSITSPITVPDKIFVEYVEEIIKPHFSDMSRQASIVDHLQLHNSLYTNHPFHHFEETVKLETDAALQALFSGKNDFSLVGSNDIHQLFGHYLSRHGEDKFIDPHDRNVRKPKVIELTPRGELQSRNREIASARGENTAIPRLSNIFVEICAHEYLLSQGNNIVKDRKLASSPQALGSMEMVNDTVRLFVEKLAMDEACRSLGAQEPAKFKRIGSLAEGLIADSCIQFFSELGAMHRYDEAVQDKLKMVENAYTGENFSLSHTLYSKTITASASEGYELFLRIYQRNLETYLKVATRENREALMQQLDQVKDIMRDIQVTDKTVMPESEEARLRAHYRNHTLSNVGHNPSTWVARAEAIQWAGQGNPKEAKR